MFKNIDQLKQFLSQQLIEHNVIDPPGSIQTPEGIDEQLNAEDPCPESGYGMIFFLDRNEDVIQLKGLPYNKQTFEFVDRKVLTEIQQNKQYENAMSVMENKDDK